MHARSHERKKKLPLNERENKKPRNAKHISASKQLFVAAAKVAAFGGGALIIRVHGGDSFAGSVGGLL